jgi:NhaP-type Na+/H+ or K+/H+ antiporter
MGVFSFDLPFDKMGVSLFFVMVFAVLGGRALNIILNSLFVNIFRTRKVSMKFQFIMWFSGLRGAIAFALAIDSLKRFKDNGDVILTMTLLYAVITIVLIGGGIAPLLEYFGVVGVPETPQHDLSSSNIIELVNENCGKRIKRWLYFVDDVYIFPVFVKT